MNLKFADDWREHSVGVHFVNPIPIDFSNLSPSKHSSLQTELFIYFPLNMKLKQRNKVWNFMDVCFCSIFFLSWHWGKSQELCQSLARWSVRAIFDRHMMVTKCYTFPAESHLKYLKTAATNPSPTFYMSHKTLVEIIFFFWFQVDLHSPRFCLSEMGHIWNAADFGQKALFSQMSF